MSEVLSGELLNRIRTRLGEDWRRTGDGDWPRTPVARRRKSEVSSPVGRMLESLLETHVFNSSQESASVKILSPNASA